MLYGSEIWDPLFIICQIAIVQSLYYVSLGFLIYATVGLYVGMGNVSLNYLMDYRAMAMNSRTGWLTILACALNAVPGAFWLSFFVQRAKKCLDFTVTCHFIHLCVCWGVIGFPKSVEWWITNLLGLTVMTLLGEWLCVRREMEDIPMSELRARIRNQAPQIELQPQSTSTNNNLNSNNSEEKTSLLQSRNNASFHQLENSQRKGENYV
eukprot:TRINITY_DN4320_c0_g1_i1.p3 TRINITY_DN4320_c0_g1~~TRINITY_DN4320_c0_g1_i1.p3  ORF type:complete len:209 (+),score=16.23 TRINITY_DN4320_c0_g1_i1:177-803(+)